MSTSSSHIGFEDKSRFVVFSGNSHPALAQGICNHLEIQLGKCEVRYFGNTEARPLIDESVRNKDVYIIQTGSSDYSEESFQKFKVNRNVNDHIQETLLLMDACKRSGCGNITLIVPCYPYARQDKKDKPRACISAKVVAKQFETFGLHRIVCVELHNSCIQGYFDGCCDNLYTSDSMVEELKRVYDVNDLVIISPDEGGVKRASIVAAKLGRPILTIRKNRDYDTENKVVASTLLGDSDELKGKIAVIVDDMLDTGGTVVKTVSLLKEEGASGVSVIVTHGILSNPAIERINSEPSLLKVFVSNTLPQFHNTQKCPKLEVYNIDSMLAEVVRRLVKGKSISEMYE
jgi:ribose-phosphate pyrophosphokinase